MKTLDRTKFINFSVAIVAAVTVGTLILLPMASSLVLPNSSYGSLSKWPGLVERATRLPITLLGLRYGHTDNFYGNTSSSIMIPGTNYNSTKKLQFHNTFYKKKTKGLKKNDKKKKKHKNKFTNNVRKSLVKLSILLNSLLNKYTRSIENIILINNLFN